MKISIRYLVLTALVVFVAGCAAPAERFKVPEPIKPPRAPVVSDGDDALFSGGSGNAPGQLRRSETPTPPTGGPAIAGLDYSGSSPELDGEPISANLESLPLPAFINEAFGNLLGLNFQIDPALERKRDLVTLRTPQAQAPNDFYRLLVQVLAAYGVAVQWRDGLVRVYPSTTSASSEPPLVLSGRALPDVPVSHRPIFQLIELNAVRIADVTQWLRNAFKLDGLEIVDDANRNAVILYGKPDLVAQAADAIRVLDRPYLRGRVSTRLEPAFVGADELARQLIDVLNAEGYAAVLHPRQSNIQAATIVALPLPSANTVLLFAGSSDLLDHAVAWAGAIDRPNPVAGGDSLFYYRVRNTRAAELASTLNGVRGGGLARGPVRSARSSIDINAPAAPPPSAPAQGSAGTADGESGAGLGRGRLLVDEPRNALIFEGAASEWERMLTLIRQMDRAARQVMIEVTIAEVTLDEGEQFGIAWLAKNNIDRLGGTLTSGRFGGGQVDDGDSPSSPSGLTYLLDVAGQTRVELNALANDNRVSVLSNPKLMVKSGEEASIDVSTEIPTIASSTASSQQTDGTSNILQSVEYRRTGIILNVRPVVYSDDRIDLEIRQEVSEALPVASGAAIQSPSIFARSVSTSLSLRDGSSILIGGMMQQSETDSDSGVPWLKDIPVLGNLFKTSGTNKSKTELIVMIVPYIIETDAQAEEVTRAITRRLQSLELPADWGGADSDSERP